MVGMHKHRCYDTVSRQLTNNRSNSWRLAFLLVITLPTWPGSIKDSLVLLKWFEQFYLNMSILDLSAIRNHAENNVISPSCITIVSATEAWKVICTSIQEKLLFVARNWKEGIWKLTGKNKLLKLCFH